MIPFAKQIFLFLVLSQTPIAQLDSSSFESEVGRAEDDGEEEEDGAEDEEEEADV